MKDRITRDQMLMEMARIASRRGTCLRRDVGAVIAIVGRTLSTGYVGAPSGLTHCSPDTCSLERPCDRTIHAEANAIAFAARHGIALKGATMYCTVSPCIHCAKLVINSGIYEFVYLEEYRDITPINLLRSAGVLCRQMSL